MNHLMSAALSVGLLAAGGFVASGDHAQTLPVSTVKADLGIGSAPTVAGLFRLQKPGNAVSCVVRKGEALSSGGVELTVEPACERLYPSLSHARVWVDKPDNTVAFMDTEGQTIIGFAIADGAGYESLEPTAPLLTLVAAR